MREQDLAAARHRGIGGAMEGAIRMLIVHIAMFYTVLGLLLGGGAACLCAGRRESSLRIASRAVAGASICGFILALFSFFSEHNLSIRLPLPLPLGNCVFSLDALSSIFLLPLFLLAAVGALLLPARIRAFEAYGKVEKIHYGKHGFFYCLLVAAMFLAVTASDAVLFLFAWEIMSLGLFFLISLDDKDSHERYASWIFLVTAHLGALPLLLLFAAMFQEAGSSEFAAFAAHAAKDTGWRNAGLLFLLAFVGFGAKSGLVPLHIWMPGAYASAPGHVIVLFSGAMTNLGIYGLMRILSLLGPLDAHWAYGLMGVGALSSILGIFFALLQSDMRRTLAYSSAENMGVICLALGAALLAGLQGASTAVLLLLGGAFLHLWNHSLFKSLLFLGVNVVKENTNVTTLQRLGGLFKRIPVTGGCVAVGCLAIAGVPPCNGFMGELLIYMGLIVGSEALGGSWPSLSFWLAFACLSVVAAFSLFTFTRMFGLGFLGEARSAESRQANEPDRLCGAAMVFLAALCLGMSFAGPFLLYGLAPFLSRFAQRLFPPLAVSPADVVLGGDILSWYAAACAGILLLFGVIFWLKNKRVRRNGETTGQTWDCGYRYPSARMQYTGGSFAHSFAVLLQPLVRARIQTPKLEGLFPSEPRAVMTIPDWFASIWERCLFRPIGLIAEKVKELQHGLVNIYILYIFIALMTALVWALGWS